ncbi:MAG: family 20 glycosylhydrolase [Lentisphaeria bacterium]|nr:family 20 glycosylhydrolase [Lentisphaeria bacterium]
MTQFKVRAAQLDLARQMESLDYCRKFMDMLSENGYNAIFLYLEDRIITKSYPYPAPNEAYTCDQIRELVAYADSRGLEVIPCVATLGHAERFLRFPQLQHLAEIRNGVKGRFGGDFMETFCVSLPEVYDFLFAYIREVAELFPSRYFHVGLDEFFDFNLCELCRKAAPDFHSEEKLFLNHVLKVHDFLKSIGKRMAMWPDMFENYHDIIKDVPKDIIMTEWHYHDDVRFCQAHFNNQTQEETLGRYSELGFEAWASPADRNINNGLSFLDYAAHYESATGFLMTSWEKNDTYPFRAFPIIAACGLKAAGANDDEAFRGMIKNLFGTEDELFTSAEKLAVTRGFARHFETASLTKLWSRGCAGIDMLPENANRTAKIILESFRDKLTKGREILDDQIASLEELIVSAEIKKDMMQQLDYGCDDKTMAKLKQDFADYIRIFRSREQEWETHRAGIIPNVFTEKIPAIGERFAKAEEILKNGAFLRLRRTHCDWYGMPKTKISFRLNGEWQVAIDGNFKPESLYIQMFEYFHTIDRKFLDADAVRIEHCGFGGLGINYLALRDNGRTLKVPGRIIDYENMVHDPEFILTDDSRFCFLGNQNMREVYEDQSQFPIMHRVDIELKDYSLF